MFLLIQEAEKLLESHPGGKKDPEALAEWKQLAAAMMVASDDHPTVDQKANGAVDWAVMLYRSRQPKGYTFEHLQTIIGGELYSLRKALQILQAAPQRRPKDQATQTRKPKSPRK